MRQLPHAGWMHNRARLITASFLTKDLHVDWRRGEAHFMRYLLCGDEAPEQRQLAVDLLGRRGSPRRTSAACTTRSSSRDRHDPTGEYVRRWVPELRDVPAGRLAEPWTMTARSSSAPGA
jgi:deoxyribodipyrimidine photo-lyase